MKALSTGVLLSGGALACEGRRLARLPHPIALRAVVDFGIGAEAFEQPETVRILARLSHFTGAVVQVAETDGAGGAGLHAGGDIIAGLDVVLAGSSGALFGGVPSAMAEVALLHHAAHAWRHIGIESLLHA